MPTDERRPTAFIVMPYGRKRDPSGRLRIDFDELWDTALRVAAERVGVTTVRADEERIGGFVHVSMYERLLLAEIVVADLTLASPNVMYELGIRHASRPRATIPIYAKVAQLPFDVAPVRAIPYRLTHKGRLKPEARDRFIDTLAQRLVEALTEDSADSPLFQLIRAYPGVSLPHEVTETFKNRVRAEAVLSTAIREAWQKLPRSQAIDRLRDLAKDVGPPSVAPTSLLLDLMLAYRDVEAYDEMLELADGMPAGLKEHITVRQQVAFAANRRKGPGGVARAVRILEEVVDEFGPDPETLGLLGRIHKDRYKELLPVAPAAAETALDAAIDSYTRGFLADFRNCYPGVNAVTLLATKGTREALNQAKELSRHVAFALAAGGALDSVDYWNLASVLEVAVLNKDESTAHAALRRLEYVGGAPWTYRSTSENLEHLRVAHKRDGDEPPWLKDVLARLSALSS